LSCSRGKRKLNAQYDRCIIYAWYFTQFAWQCAGMQSSIPSNLLCTLIYWVLSNLISHLDFHRLSSTMSTFKFWYKNWREFLLVWSVISSQPSSTLTQLLFPFGQCTVHESRNSCKLSLVNTQSCLIVA
jgi:hypothetical protein